MSTYRPRRAIPSVINTPTAINSKGLTPVNQEQAERVLTEFIELSEAIATTVPGQADSTGILDAPTGLSNSTGNAAVVSQLKRLQRDLRGLPPNLSDFMDDKRKIEEEERPNKRIKFDSEPVEEPETVPETLEVEAEVSEEVPETVEEVPQVSDIEESPKKEKKDKKDKKEKKEKKDKKDKKSKKEKKDQ